MKNKGLLVAVAVLAGLGGAVYWSEKTKIADEKKPPSGDAPPKILTIPEDQIQGIRLEKRGAEPTVLSRASGKWEMTGPKPLAADQDAVNGVVQNLTNLGSDRLIDEKAAKLQTYGLATPSEEVVITRKDGKKDTLLLGDDEPTGAGTYAKLANDPRVFTVATFVKTGIDKSPKDLRDKRLLTFNSDKLSRVAVTAKGGTFEFGKNGQGEWQLLKPAPMRADGPQVDELVRKLKDAKMDVNLSDEEAKKAAASYVSGTKVATATTTDASGTETLDVRKGKDNNYYAKSSVVEGIYKIPNELAEGLNKTADDFRNKKLFDFGFSDPNQVSIGSSVFQKAGEKWMAGNGQVDSGSVQNLIDKLRDLTATGFATGPKGDPFLTMSVTSNDNKRVERVTITKLGDQYFATREGEPSVYQLDAKAVEDVQKAAAAVKPFAPPKAAAKK
ncbi:MAG: DUF4340 domain-containing protein [Acidobacteriota bacterium]|nr:DUF4340 domain-containing protein [Acidobacteriota bacterium]